MDELQEMREQMASLKEKLNKQEIVNEKNLRKLMFRKALRFKVFMWVGILLLATPTVALWIMNFAWFEGTHTDFQLILGTIATAIMLTMSIIGTSIIKIKDIRSGNLQTVKEQIEQMHRMNSTSLAEGKTRVVWNVFSVLVIVLFLARRYSDGRFKFEIGDYIIFILLVLLTTLDLFYPRWQIKCREWITKKTGRKKRITEWDEYIRQIEELSELDEEKADDKK